MMGEDDVCIIYTSDNKMLSIYMSSPNRFKLKPTEYRSEHVLARIKTHKDGTKSLFYLREGKMFSCFCDREGQKLTLKLCKKNQGNFDKRFRFFQEVASDQRTRFESCVMQGWFIHSENNKVTINNNGIEMEAKYFKIKEIRQSKLSKYHYC